MRGKRYKKKTPKEQLELIKIIVAILAGLTTIIRNIYKLFFEG